MSARTGGLIGPPAFSSQQKTPGPHQFYGKLAVRRSLLDKFSLNCYTYMHNSKTVSAVWKVEDVKIVVSNSYEGSIYEQIKRQILHAILSFELLPGEQLPSLRSLAKDLKVGVLTVNRAYAELESEGYIENMQGKGCFVANKSSDLIKKHLLDEAVKKMELSILESKNAGVSDEEILALFRESLRRMNNA